MAEKSKHEHRVKDPGAKLSFTSQARSELNLSGDAAVLRKATVQAKVILTERNHANLQKDEQSGGGWKKII